MFDLEKIAKLAGEGPVKHEPAKRRVRGLMGGEWLFDTLNAKFVWEHAYYPMFYIPLKDLPTEGSTGGADFRNTSSGDGFYCATLSFAGKEADLAIFEKGPLKDFVKLDVAALDWYAEDEKLLGTHPKDPYKRIECLPSSREIRVEVDGKIVAQSTSNVFLHETMLRTRYYLQPTTIKDWTMLSRSNTTSFCPYKGQASYYNLKVGGTEIKDAIWYYVYPTAESAQIQGLLCFYNEKVDIFVDGVQEEK